MILGQYNPHLIYQIPAMGLENQKKKIICGRKKSGTTIPDFLDFIQKP